MHVDWTVVTSSSAAVLAVCRCSTSLNAAVVSLLQLRLQKVAAVSGMVTECYNASDWLLTTTAAQKPR